jgi:ribosomal protein S18 acetylase RimI-like enzyme
LGDILDKTIVDRDMISIRPADENDMDALCSLDLIAQREEQRREFIRGEVISGNYFVAIADEKVIGYGVLNYTFFHVGNIDMLYIRVDHRRNGAGAALIRHMESLCQTPKLFTSTNLSNLPMQSLLAKSGYVLSGVIHNLDEDDPEIVYFKLLR